MDPPAAHRLAAVFDCEGPASRAQSPWARRLGRHFKALLMWVVGTVLLSCNRTILAENDKVEGMADQSPSCAAARRQARQQGKLQLRTLQKPARKSSVSRTSATRRCKACIACPLRKSAKRLQVLQGESDGIATFRGRLVTRASTCHAGREELVHFDGQQVEICSICGMARNSIAKLRN